MQCQYFNGLKFNLDKKTGYYLSSAMILKNRQERMHRYVWRFYFGEIPKNHHIHHKNGNKQDNLIENLELISSNNHMALHAKEYTKNNIEKVNIHLKEINPLSKEWHKSETGRQWHKNHYKNSKDALHEKFSKKCLSCQIEFENIKNSKFCSNKCKSKFRRDNMLDNITKICGVCNNEYFCSKYSKSKSCSRKCGKSLCKNKINPQN